MKLSDYNKAIPAVTAAAGVIVASGLVHGTAELIVNTAIAVIGAVGVILFPPNTKNGV